ncbi:glycerophosphodiester phosphodiesterase [Nocardiopsis ganjiahuensis]|uniref:glycerophosphodiester phosphodiesterase n=1 Tax=Nocardiopsis ganjiahuensis TaxID=239984 RepID=UPI000349C58E|nr:glycerophosphodiester phosphodiesterase family protein [Nocardiopsis ganjiahuensis]
MHHRIGFAVGAVSLAFAVVTSPALAAPDLGAAPAAPGPPGPAPDTTSGSTAESGAERVSLRAGALPPQQPSQSRPLIAVAHRGASGYAPENTLAAIDEAYRLGAETVELDVQLTSDDRLVLMHDTRLDRTTDVAEVFPGRAPYDVADFSLAEIRRLDAGSFFDEEFAGEPVPLLSEALDRLHAHGMNLLLEVKEPELYPGIEHQIAVELARRPQWLVPNAPGEPHRIVVQSFDWDSTRVSKELLPSVPHALLGRVPEDEIDQYDWAHMINPNHTTIDADYVGEVHDAGMEIMPYTINDPAVMGRVLEMGTDGFITDFPDVGRQAIDDFLAGTSAAARGHTEEQAAEQTAEQADEPVLN